ncbi:MAG TPA: hypothetical protein VKY86_18165 [Promicromonospora sp.]|nr:hypothetical protein [Promicromonospora sp.]
MTGSTTVLVTGAGGPAGRALGSQLSARAASAVDAAVGRAVAGVGVDVVPVAGGAFPVTDQAPRADAWDYVTGMRDLVVRYAPDLVIPTVQDELPQVATLAQALAGESPPAGRWTFPDAVGVVLTADPGPAALAADKLLTMLALEKAGVPVPRFAVPTDFGSTAEALASTTRAAASRPTSSKPSSADSSRSTPPTPANAAGPASA